MQVGNDNKLSLIYGLLLILPEQFAYQITYL